MLSVCVLGCALCLVLDGVQSTLPDTSTVNVLDALLISAVVMRLAPFALLYAQTPSSMLVSCAMT